jgi:hypothetical protein
MLGWPLERINELAKGIVEARKHPANRTRMAQIDPSLVRHLTLVAEGRLLPEFFQRFGDRKGLLNRLERMPVSVQRELLDKELPLLVYGPDGAHDARHVSLEELVTGDQWQQLLQMLAPDHVRTPGEQHQYLIERSFRAAHGSRRKS